MARRRRRARLRRAGRGRDGGRGTLAHFGLASERIVYMGTLGKAAGVAGAFVAAHPAVIETLVQTARPYIFTTAAPPLLAEALRASLADHARRRRAPRAPRRAHRAASARACAACRGRCCRFADADPAARRRRQRGGGRRSPTRCGAAASGCRRSGRRRCRRARRGLRVTLSAAHTRDDVDALADALADARAPRSARSRAMSGALHVESTGHGPPLVLLHGWAMHSGIWGPLAAAARAAVSRARRRPAGARPQRAAARRSRWTASSRRSTAAFAAEHAPAHGARLVAGRPRRDALGARASRRASAASCSSRRRRASSPATTGRTRCRGETLARFGDELHVAWKLTMQRFLALQMQGSEHGRATLAALREPDLRARRAVADGALRRARADPATRTCAAKSARIAQPALVVSGDRDTLALPGGRPLARRRTCRTRASR